MSNNIYKILNSFNKVAQEPQKPAPKTAAPKSQLQEGMEQVLQRKLIAEKKAKPDFLDMDKDGNKKEPMKKAAKDTKKVSESGMDESALQAYLGKKKYGEQGMKALQKAGRDGASKEKMASIRAKHDKMDEANEQVQEKAVSKAQQKFMGMVHAAKKGEKAASPAVEKAAKGMSKKAAKDFASTKHKGLPQHVKEAIIAAFEAGMTKDQIIEGWDDMMKDVAKRGKEEKGTGKFDKKKDQTTGGTVYTRKYNAKTGETDDETNTTKEKRGRGRPKKSAFESKHTAVNKLIKESIGPLVEGRIEGGVWVDKPGNVPVPQNPEVAKPTPKAAPTPNMGSAAKALAAPNKVDPKAKVIPSDPEGVKEDDMEEGNAFSGAVAKAKADGIQKGEKITVGGKEYPVKEDEDLEESLNQMRRIAGLPVVEAKDKTAKKDYDGDGKVESGKDEYLGSKIAAAKKAGKLKEGEMCSKCDCDPCECDDDKEKVDECMSPLGNAAQEMQDSAGKMNVSTNMSSDGNKSVTITADGDAAAELMQMLKLAGMGGGDQSMQAEPDGKPDGVMVVARGEEEQGGEEEVDEEKDERYHANTTPEEHVMPTQVQTKGGDGDVAGQEKKMSKHGYQFGDNPQAMRESATLKLMREYEAIKVKK